MFEWSEEQTGDPRCGAPLRRRRRSSHKVDELEHGDTPPYEVIRKLYRTFGLDAMARDGFKRQLERKLSDTPAPRRAPGRRRQCRHDAHPDH
jgi:hypothetical protein